MHVKKTVLHVVNPAVETLKHNLKYIFPRKQLPGMKPFIKIFAVLMRQFVTCFFLDTTKLLFLEL